MRRVWSTLLPAWDVLDRAEDLMRRYSLSVWDAILIAACLEGGVTCLYSEDFDAYTQIDGMQVENPLKGV